MAPSTSTSSSIPSIADRRQQVRSANRKRRFRCAWKFCLSAGLLAGAVSMARLPEWRITSLEDITIEGNQVLSDAELRPILPIIESTYIWQVEPSRLEAALLRHPLLRQATVNRHLFPPPHRRPCRRTTASSISQLARNRRIY